MALTLRKLITGIDLNKILEYALVAGGGALYGTFLSKQSDMVKYLAVIGGALANTVADIPFLDPIVKGMIGALIAEKLSAKTPTPVTIKYVGRKIIV